MQDSTKIKMDIVKFAQITAKTALTITETSLAFHANCKFIVITLLQQAALVNKATVNLGESRNTAALSNALTVTKMGVLSAHYSLSGS